MRTLSRKATEFAAFLAVFSLLAVLFTAGAARAADTYRVQGRNILKNGAVGAWAGVNALNLYDRKAAEMAGYNVNIVREVIGAVKEVPVGNGFVWGSAGSPLNGLQDVVNDNRAHGKITILCPFNWTDGSAQYAGTVPSQHPAWNEFLAKMRAWGAQFKDQPDVWIETWNEPHETDDAPSWYYDQKSIVDAIRSGGNANIVVVPGAKWGQSEAVILANGQSLLNSQSNKNIVFDLHCYDWQNDSQARSEARIQSVLDKNFALILGECGPGLPEGYRSNPAAVLNAALAKRVTTLTWYWKKGGDDNCLFRPDGSPKNDVFGWHDMTRSFLSAFAAGAPLVDGRYFLRPQCAPGSSLEAAGWNNFDGANVQIWGHSGGDNQAWYVQRQGNGSYKLTAYGGGSPRVLDARAPGNTNGNNVQIWTDGGAANQRWYANYQGAGWFKLNPLSSAGMCLDVNAASAANATNVQIWQDNGSAAQRWSFATH